MRFRKKLVVEEAYQWFKNGDHPDDHCPPDAKQLKLWPDHNEYIKNVEGRVVHRFNDPVFYGSNICPECGKPYHHVHGWVCNGDGGHRVCPGDWIITGVQGGHYPCKPDIFAETYEKVEEHFDPSTGGPSGST